MFYLSPVVSKKIIHLPYTFVETKVSCYTHWWGKQKYQVTNVGVKSKIVTFATSIFNLKWMKLNVKYHNKI